MRQWGIGLAAGVSFVLHVAFAVAVIMATSRSSDIKRKFYTVDLVYPAPEQRVAEPETPASPEPAPAAAKPAPAPPKPAPVKKAPPPKDAAESLRVSKSKALDELRKEKALEKHREETIKGIEARDKALDNIRATAARRGKNADPVAGMTQEEIDRAVGEYSDKVMSRIRTNWVPPIENNKAGLETLVQITVRHDGSFTVDKVITPSGSRAFDQSVLRALAKTERVPPPPLGKREIEIVITFRPDE